MLRGFYTAASGVVSQQKRLNNVANNLANASTVGYKRDNLVLGTFGDHMTLRMNAYQHGGETPVGPGNFMQVVDGKYTDYSQGGFEATARPMDLSIMGDGFFVIQDGEGNERLTRDGQFSLDEDGFLILPGFGRVQGQEGDIELERSDFVVDSRGYIFLADEDDPDEYEEIARLQIAIPDDNDYDALEKVSEGLYEGTAYTVFDVEEADEDNPIPFNIRQYQLEKSNVNMSEEMTELIASQRSLQSCSQVVKIYDEIAERVSTQVSRA